MTANDWLARLRHDLVKRLVWPARDRRDMGVPGPARPGELAPSLTDDEGNSVTAQALWTLLRGDLPGPAPADTLARFGAAVASAERAGAAGDVDGVLALEIAFRELSRALAEGT